MNIQIVFLTIAALLFNQSSAAPLDATETIADPISTTPPIAPTTAVPITTAPVPLSTTPPIASTTTVPITTTPVPTTTTTELTTTTTTTLAPDLDREWEDLVLAGPTVVNYLSLFMVLASRVDQVLIPPSNYTVKYIQNINSLRDILTQVSLAMKNTFQSARDDLIRIQNSMEEIPDHMKAGLLLIKSGTSDILDTLLPYTLRNIDRAAEEASSVSKPTLARFTLVGLLLEELVTVLQSTPATDNADYLLEANAYANNTKTQWNLLIDLFQKFSDLADLTQASITSNYVNEIEQAQQSGGFSSQTQRQGHLDRLVPYAILIDQSSYLLNIMTNTYSDISSSYIESQISSNNFYLHLSSDSDRSTKQRDVWETTVSQSVKVARLAQTRHNDFVNTTESRQAQYITYLNPTY